MKVWLILCLLVTLNCCKFLDISICLVKSDEFRDIIVNVLTAIKEKNWMKIVSTAMKNFEEVKSIIQKCTTSEKVPEKSLSKDEIDKICIEKCQDLVEYHEREECFKDCYFSHL